MNTNNINIMRKSIVIFSDKHFLQIIETKNKKISKINITNNSSIAFGSITFGEIKSINQKFFFIECENSKQQIFCTNSFHENIRIGQKIFVQIEKENTNKKKHKASTVIQIRGASCVVISNKALSLAEANEFLTSNIDLTNINTARDTIPKFFEIKNVSKLSEDENFMGELFKILKVIKNALEQKIGLFSEIEKQILLNSETDFYVEDESIVKRIRFFAKLIQHKACIHKSIDYPKLFINENYDIFKSKIKLEGGGSFVVNRSEGMTFIDVNSDTCSNFSDINIRATKCIYEYINARNVMGIIVVDFISLNKPQKEKIIEANAIKDLMSKDKSILSVKFLKNVYIAIIIRKSKGLCVDDYLFQKCNKCNGLGSLPSKSALSQWSQIILLANKTNSKNKTIVFNNANDCLEFLKNNPQLLGGIRIETIENVVT